MDACSARTPDTACDGMADIARCCGGFLRTIRKSHWLTAIASCSRTARLDAVVFAAVFTGYRSIEDIQHFRQLGSKTPATRVRPACGIETRPTAGRTCQRRRMASRNGCSARSSTVRLQYRRSLHLRLLRDGCLMKGVPRACSLRHAGVGKLIVSTTTTAFRSTGGERLVHRQHPERLAATLARVPGRRLDAGA